MDYNEILSELDNLYNTGRMEDAGAFLEEQYALAVSSGEPEIALGILNEQIGYYRVTTQYEKALVVISDIHSLIEQMKLTGTIEEGTSLLNIATIYRAMGKLDEAEKCYKQVEVIYANKLDVNDYRIAGLYNNMSLMYMETGDCASSVACLKKALPIISNIPDGSIELAVTHTNLGQAYCRLEDYENAKASLDTAEALFIQTNPKDVHYSGCATAQGYLYLQLKDYDKAVAYYEKALASVYQCFGLTANFKDIQKDLRTAYKLRGDKEYSSMLDVCEAYYETYGRPMIHEHFADYEDVIAVGLCGEGSECFGMEDAISMDHDCGPGFSMWVSEEIYDKIGEKLEEAYKELPQVFAGYIRMDSAMGKGRCGVCTIDGFFKRVLGGRDIPQTEAEWLSVDEAALATATNGRVFVDMEGTFSSIRSKLLAYYPRKVWIEKLSRELMYAAQTGQYNYGRSMARGEYVTARIALSEYMKSIMHVVYLCNETYMPYYKWQHPMLKKLSVLPEIPFILEAINDMPQQREAWENYIYDGNPNPKDMIAQTIEIIANMVTQTLKKMKLTTSNDLYLEVQGREVLTHMDDKEKLIEQIVEFEWYEFDLVKNEGGRASCQEDWDTFSIMRKSQYLTWTEDMLHEYLWHLDDSLKHGRNLITEKYGRMMASTAPDRYDEIKDEFPVLSEQRISIMEQIISIQVEWMEAFAKQYPKLAGNARIIHTSEDTPYNTSYETYLRGELGTYSEELMKLYGEFIVSLAKNNQNLAYLTMQNTAKLYGYNSLEDAEKAL